MKLSHALCFLAALGILIFLEVHIKFNKHQIAHRDGILRQSLLVDPRCFCIPGKCYILKEKLALQDFSRARGRFYKAVEQIGSREFGEVWMAATTSNCVDQNDSAVLKKVKNKESAKREVYFGKMFRGKQHIGRYIESFDKDGETWLVFHHEGISLYNLMHSDVQGRVTMSDWWLWLRQTPDGELEFREIVFQLVLALDEIHQNNVTHRDIKPENVLLRMAPNGRLSELRVIDFGSALDFYSLNSLYSSGPTEKEETASYAPPETVFPAGFLENDRSDILSTSYDMWSLGVTIVVLSTGKQDVLEADDRQFARISKQYEHDFLAREEALKLQGYLNLCVLPPEDLTTYYGLKVPRSCDLSERIRSLDSLGIGLESDLAVDLVQRLLVWAPEDRLTAKEARSHPFFSQV